MIAVEMRVNGTSIAQLVEPRTTLADLLRDKLDLTGLHLGCEQGVCGACTIYIDGAPARSCITNAASCGGAEVRTIEDFDDDALMGELRAAFNKHHGLQCGFCTPGMLVMARDIVQRLPGADEDRIREELCGNLCRCTGYAGIVKAIRSVSERRDGATLSDRRELGPVGSAHPVRSLEGAHVTPTPAASAGKGAATGSLSRAGLPKEIKATAPPIRQTIELPFLEQDVWQRFADVPAMIRCIPGAKLIESSADGAHLVGMRVKMGAITPEFRGVAAQTRHDAERAGTIVGTGQDQRSSSRASGQVRYTVRAAADSSSIVEIEVRYALTGMLAQFARGGIVAHIAAALTAQFADNLSRSMASGADVDDAAAENELALSGTLSVAVKAWTRDLLSRVFGRRKEVLACEDGETTVRRESPDLDTKPVGSTGRGTPPSRSSLPSEVRPTAPPIKQSIAVPFSADEVWARFADVPAMIRCIPGAQLIESGDDGAHLAGMRVKMGAITPEFRGVAAQTRDDVERQGVIIGAGQDQRSSSRAAGEVRYRVVADGEATSRVDIEVRYALTGMLAQFARGGIVTHLASAITAQFADNLTKTMLSSPDATAPAIVSGGEIRLPNMLGVALKSWVADTFNRVARRRAAEQKNGDDRPD